MCYRPRTVDRWLIAVRARTCEGRFPPAVVLIAARFFPAGRFRYGTPALMVVWRSVMFPGVFRRRAGGARAAPCICLLRSPAGNRGGSSHAHAAMACVPPTEYTTTRTWTRHNARRRAMLRIGYGEAPGTTVSAAVVSDQ